MMSPDVPSPINLCNMEDALEWERTAMQRPNRIDFFSAIADELESVSRPALKVLELGSGPGFLALYLLERLPRLELVLLDNSKVMHELARKRLGSWHHRVSFLERNFKDADWAKELGPFDAVVTLQAVHELRHKRYASALHRQVASQLTNAGCYLVCDHYCGENGMQNDQLYMTPDEHRASLENAGYKVREVLKISGRVLYHAAAQ